MATVVVVVAAVVLRRVLMLSDVLWTWPCTPDCLTVARPASRMPRTPRRHTHEEQQPPFRMQAHTQTDVDGLYVGDGDHLFERLWQMDPDVVAEITARSTKALSI
jgi:hypothetical protein